MDKKLCKVMKSKNMWVPSCCDFCKDRDKCEEKKTKNDKILY